LVVVLALVGHVVAATPGEAEAHAFDGAWVSHTAEDGRTVVVPLSAVLADDPDDPEEPPVDWLVDRMTVRLTPGTNTEVVVRAELQALSDTWVQPRILLPGGVVDDVSLDGRPTEFTTEGDATAIPMELKGRHVLELRGSMPTPTSAASISWWAMPEPARALLVVDAAGLDVDVTGAIPRSARRFDIIQTGQVNLRWKPEAAPAPRPGVVTCQAATALHLEEGGMEGRARLRWRILHVPQQTVELRLPGKVSDLEVTGSAVAGHRREGERVIVELHEPTEGVVDMELAFRGSVSGGKAETMPVVQPTTTGGSPDGWVSLWRGATDTVVPQVSGGLEVVPARQLPRWSQGLLGGTPVTHFRVSSASPRLSAQVLSFEPAETPPTLVDEARYQVSYTADGAAVMQARYQVRNDRSQYLRVTLPLGWRALGVRVTGEVVQPVRTLDETGATVLLVPLEKSVLALDGLVSFPVELSLWGTEAAWDPKGERPVSTPSVDAPIAYASWELNLPLGTAAKELVGPGDVVDNWADGSVGLALGYAYKKTLDTAPSADTRDDQAHGRDMVKTSGKSRGPRIRWPSFGAHKEVGEAPAPEDQAAAEAVLRHAQDEDRRNRAQSSANFAYRAYQDNDFEAAEGWIQEALEEDPDNATASALWSNMSMLRGEDDTGGDDAQSRRIRELAYARSQEKETDQSDALDSATQAERSGDYDKVIEELEKAKQIAEELSLLEQQEAVDQKGMVDELEARLKSAKTKKKASVSSSSSSPSGPAGSPDPPFQVARPPPPPTAAPPPSRTASKRGRASKSNAAPELAVVPDRYVELILPEPEPESKPKPSPALQTSTITELDFASSPVELDMTGALVKPQGELLLDRKKAEMSPLIEMADIGARVNQEVAEVAGGIHTEEWQHDDDEDFSFDFDEMLIEGEPQSPEPTAILAYDAFFAGAEAPEEEEDGAFDIEEKVRSGTVGQRPPDDPFPTAPLLRPQAPSPQGWADPEHPVAGGPQPAPLSEGADLERPLSTATPPPERPPSGTWADPERPPPPPPVDEPIGLLDVPAGVDGAQLTLHPPVTGALVRIEQRLVPADRPLRADLRYRLRPVRAEPLQD